ncbi:MAG: four helix bundle protein [Flavobacteriales bacterium]
METGNSDLKDRTKSFSLRIIRLVKSLDNNVADREIGRQLIRSGMSVGANTRAAFRGRSNREFVAKLGIVIEEADECGFWIELLQETSEAKKLNKEELLLLHQEASELTSIFVSIVKKNK